ncbi:hypothetical protein AAG906_016055 [Vitis piasezkii]
MAECHFDSWIRVKGRLVRGSDQYSQSGHTSVQRDMDPQYATVDQLAEITDTMASLRDAILGLGQRIDGHQAPPLRDDTRAHIERGLIMSWDGYDDLPVAALYTGIGCPRIHLQLYSAIMCRHRLDETQMIMLFPLFLSVDVYRRELKALRKRPDETVTSFISWQALYGIKEGISKGLWVDSSPSDSKGKKPGLGRKPLDVGTIGMMEHRPAIPIRPVGPAYLHSSPQLVYATQHHFHRGQLDSSHSLGCH